MTINIPNDIDNITFNGNDLDELKVNGTTIWSRSSGGYTNPMYIESQQNGSTLTLSKTGNPSETYYTSSDNSSYQAYTYGTTITLDAGERVYWYSPTQGVHSDNDYVKFVMSGNFKVGGNIQSLNNYSTSVGDQGYIYLFQSCSAISDVSELKLTATTVGHGAYVSMFSYCNITTPPTISATTFTGKMNCSRMFSSCSSLTTAPVLPATTLGENCYSYMFQYCSSLTSVPSNMLPATTLANKCYNGMFSDCYALTTVPSNMLHATTLADNCYYRMFYTCYNLTTAPVLPATTLANNCYYEMFRGCTHLSSITALFTDAPNTSNGTYNWLKNVSATGTFTMNAIATWNPENYRGVSGVPNDWTVKIKPYDNPFYTESYKDGSTVSLTINGNPSETYYISYDNMTAYQAYTYGTTVTLNYGERVYWYSPTQAVHSDSGYVRFSMSGKWSVGGNIQSLNNYSTSVGDYGYFRLLSNNSALAYASKLLLPATTLGESCYRNMFSASGMSSLPAILPATTLADSCYRDMFYACGKIKTAPELPATTLVSNCYYQMFYGCYSLNSITALFTNTPNTSSSTQDWVRNVSGSGTFTMNANASWNPVDYRGNSGVPYYWTVTTVTPQ